MEVDYSKKSTVEEIRARFDADVERFSNLETGQSATIDAPLAMELITRAALVSTSPISNVLDIGCGAGNNTLKLLECAPNLNCDLLDLSKNMLARAKERVSASTKGNIRTFCGDFRNIPLEENSYDVVLACAVLHHLRDDFDWESAFKKIFSILRKGGSFWITDLVSHSIEAVQNIMWSRYGEYLSGLGGDGYKEKVFEYIAREDTPRPIFYQLELMKSVGFSKVEILHKNSCFAAYGAIK